MAQNISTADVQRRAQNIGSKAKSEVSDDIKTMKEGVQNFISEGAPNFSKDPEAAIKYAKDLYGEVSDSLASASKSAQKWVKSNPVYATLGVAAVGAVVGILLYRSRKS